nr:hypothetical protein [Streptomyces sp. TP-A0356]
MSVEVDDVEGLAAVLGLLQGALQLLVRRRTQNLYPDIRPPLSRPDQPASDRPEGHIAVMAWPADREQNPDRPVTDRRLPFGGVIPRRPQVDEGASRQGQGGLPRLPQQLERHGHHGVQAGIHLDAKVSHPCPGLPPQGPRFLGEIEQRAEERFAEFRQPGGTARRDDRCGVGGEFAVLLEIPPNFFVIVPADLQVRHRNLGLMPRLSITENDPNSGTRRRDDWSQFDSQYPLHPL